jgi:hypothetical protein
MKMIEHLAVSITANLREEVELLGQRGKCLVGYREAFNVWLLTA